VPGCASSKKVAHSAPEIIFTLSSFHYGISCTSDATWPCGMSPRFSGGILECLVRGIGNELTRSAGDHIFGTKVMHSAANRLADFAGGDHVNSATKTQTPSAKVAAPRHSSGRLIFRYGLALGSVAAAVALGFLADRCDLHESVFTFFVLAVALTSWYAGVWPAVIAFAIGELAFNYFFTPPLYTLSVTREDLAYFPVLAFFSGLLIWFGVVRRRAEADLRQSRDELEIKVAERTAELRKTNEPKRFCESAPACSTSPTTRFLCGT
jgi:K+-sensing histidine kinase KdpD